MFGIEVGCQMFFDNVSGNFMEQYIKVYKNIDSLHS